METRTCAHCGDEIEERDTVLFATWYSTMDTLDTHNAAHCPDADDNLHEPDLEAEADEEKDRQDEVEFAEDYGVSPGASLVDRLRAMALDFDDEEVGEGALLVAAADHIEALERVEWGARRWLGAWSIGRPSDQTRARDALIAAIMAMEPDDEDELHS